MVDSSLLYIAVGGVAVVAAYVAGYIYGRAKGALDQLRGDEEKREGRGR